MKKVVDLKELANSVVAPTGGSDVVKETFDKYLSNSYHAFGKQIKVDGKINIESIDTLINGRLNSNVRLPLSGLTYATIRFSTEFIKELIMSSKILNPVIETELDIVTNFDKAYIEAKEKSGDKVSEEEVKVEEGEIKTNKVKGRIIKDVVFSKGQCHVIFDNHMLIGKTKGYTLFSKLPINEQNRIVKSSIPKELIRLRNSLIINRSELNIGRLGLDLALPIDISTLFKEVILPRIIVERGAGGPSLNIHGESKYLDIYSKFIKVGAYEFNSDFFYFAIEVDHNRSNLELLLKKNTFVCCNLSFSNEAFKQVLARKIRNDYCDTALDGIEYPVTQEGIERKYKDREELIENLGLVIPFVPLSDVAAFKSTSGRTVSDLFKIDGTNIPLFIPIIEVKNEVFRKELNNNMANSLLYKLHHKTSIQIDNKKVMKYFANLVDDDGVVIMNSLIDNSYIGICPNIKKSILSIISDNVNDFSVSVNSDSSNIAFSIQIDTLYN